MLRFVLRALRGLWRRWVLGPRGAALEEGLLEEEEVAWV
jgi:hypothetical protein